jgi:hypothetical protein
MNDTEQFTNVPAYSVIEMQAFIVGTVGKCECTMTNQSCRAPSFVMAPTVDGELERGSQLPLAVSVPAREDDVWREDGDHHDAFVVCLGSVLYARLVSSLDKGSL